MAKFETWLLAEMHATRKSNGVNNLFELPQYDAWRHALLALGREHDVVGAFKDGSSVGYASKLLAAGVDPEQIKAIYLLTFQ